MEVEQVTATKEVVTWSIEEQLEIPPVGELSDPRFPPNAAVTPTIDDSQGGNRNSHGSGMEDSEVSKLPDISFPHTNPTTSKKP